MRVRWCLLAVAIVVMTGAVYGQGSVGGFTMAAPFGGVQSAPFSADITNETTRTLADGNRIHQETHGKEYRDSQGRTRRETEFAPPTPAAGNFREVFIMDPVQRTIIILDPRTKTAHIHKLPDMSTAATQGTTNAVPVRPQRHATTAKGEQLGTKEMEGLPVTGTRTTRTTEAGEIGNDKPLVTVSETWYSPDLRTAVLNITDDPQWGRTTTRLTNIQREEPDASLFQVPADYQIKDDNRN